jgi:predicted ATP-dependent endonuclease of OLD family
MLARTESNHVGKYIFLFDEPGTALHPAGQVNLQRVFERLALKDQFVYATHSLFLVNHNRPERNRVVSKDSGGTKVDQKPYLRNWRAVRDSLGLILAGNFFIADTTLLVEGESDALYVGAMLAAFDRADIIDIDLNLFSVQWPGNSRAPGKARNNKGTEGFAARLRRQNTRLARRRDARARRFDLA